MIPELETATLIVVDIQQKLLDAMEPAIASDIVRNTGILIDLVEDAGGSVIYTEQYPRGLGPTVDPLLKRLGNATRFEKIAFSCLGEPTFCEQALPMLGEDIIIVGMEAHVCVLLTVLDLVGDALADHRERTVYVPVDAVCSRKKLHWQNALDQMAEATVVLTNTETLTFQNLGEAGTERFKRFSRQLR